MRHRSIHASSLALLVLLLTLALGYGRWSAGDLAARPQTGARLAQDDATGGLLIPLALLGGMPTEVQGGGGEEPTSAASATVVETALPSPEIPASATPTLWPTPSLTATAAITPTEAAQTATPGIPRECPEPRVICAPCPGCTATPAAVEGTPTVCPVCRPRRSAVDTPDPARLPIGDGKLSSAPEVGKIWSCTTEFGGGGAFKDGPWIKVDGTFDFTAKAVVDGQVDWPHRLSISLQGDRRVVSGNDLPRHSTGTYPIQTRDDAYQYDRNPNRIAEQTVAWSLPALPQEATAPSCVGLGAIGIMLSGSYVFNGLDALGRDAVAHEIQDGCQGHPERNGSYHYHSLSVCADDPGSGHSGLVGYALDGFGIFGRRGEDGLELASSQLDACHGHTNEIDWDGQRRTMYHYHATLDYPYTVGCYRGTPLRTGGGGGGRPPRP